MPGRLAPAVIALALLPAVAAVAQVQAIVPTFQLDRKRDVRGPLDIVRVAMSTREDGSLRGEVTMRRAWEIADIGPGGSVCLKLYVKAQPDAQPPDYLVCVAPPAEGEALSGRVMRNRSNGLPRTVAAAVVTRPTRRTVYFSFEPSAIRRPAALDFAGESVWRGERCPRATGCTDLGPDAPAARHFRLHGNTSSG
jgi:hypothetical protein